MSFDAIDAVVSEKSIHAALVVDCVRASASLDRGIVVRLARMGAA